MSNAIFKNNYADTWAILYIADNKILHFENIICQNNDVWSKFYFKFLQKYKIFPLLSKNQNS